MQFDFFYAGEAKTRNMYIVRNGKIAWSYIDTTGRGEISDAVLMANGDVLFAHQYGVTLINRSKKVLWKYHAPEGFETHTAHHKTNMKCAGMIDLKAAHFSFGADPGA